MARAKSETTEPEWEVVRDDSDDDRAIDLRIRQLEVYARLLDAVVTIPGTRIRVGLDALFGLLPGFGDALMALAGSVIVVESARLGVPLLTMCRMVLNLVVDGLLGSVPVLGDLFDVVWTANLMNASLLRHHYERGDLRERSQKNADRLVLVVGVAFIAVAILFLIGALVSLGAFFVRVL